MCIRDGFVHGLNGGRRGRWRPISAAAGGRGREGKVSGVWLAHGVEGKVALLELLSAAPVGHDG